ncbi:hypothetical protein CYMTET_52294 [Cymbomonas tetramitiformis]|uniref:Uncharacterized protein n=1 Tax=Cymbomonas tetramitiformis TaxID=36881 RepID=A0AAE0BKL8_9CHLO|nr:hypothetical protein CYMTET_52294 [Cymbomonas tetramitiformis]
MVMREVADGARAQWPTRLFAAACSLLTAHYITERWSRHPFSDSFREEREVLRSGDDEALSYTRRDSIRQFVKEVFPAQALQRLLPRIGNHRPPTETHLGLLALPGLVGGPSVVPGTAGPSSSALVNPAEALATGTRARPPGPHLCPLCGGDHLYRVGFYERTGAITKPCNKIKTMTGGAKKRCIEKHASAGPLTLAPHLQDATSSTTHCW